MADEAPAVNPVLRTIAAEYGTPCYVYFMDEVRERIARIRSAFANRFRISYAVKSNPNPLILQRLRDLADMLDVSSAGEVRRALQAAWKPALLSFTGPGKTRTDLQTATAADVGDIVLESVEEAELLNEVAASARGRQHVLLRIAPRRVPRGFGLNMSGKPSQFGIDEEEADDAIEAIRALPHVELSGFHIYSGTQCLSEEAITENYEIFIEIFRRLCGAHAVRPRKLIFGSGIGIPYYENERPVDLDAIAARIIPSLDALKRDARLAVTELVLETGRYLVGEAGVYVTRVVRKKHSRGVDICICDGGMNHHLGAAGHLGSLIQRNYRMFKIGAVEPQGPEQSYTLVGPLCTSIDTLGRQVTFRGLEAGDLIGIRSSGAYGLTASPMHFISHAPPKEIVVETMNGRLRIEDGTQFEAYRSPGTRESLRP